MAERNKSMKTVVEAAAYLGVCARTLRRWDASGLLPAAERTVGLHRRYTLVQLAAFKRTSFWRSKFGSR